MKKISFLLIGILVFSPVMGWAQNEIVPLLDYPQDISPDACRNNVNDMLAKEQRMYRTVLYGQKKAADESVSTVRFDIKGSPWIKTADNEWQHFVKEAPSDGIPQDKLEKQGDDDMDDVSETEERKGIFETKGVLTSQLIPQLTQSVRALGCRIDLVCATAVQSIVSTERFEIVIPGCIDTDPIRDPYPGCHLEEDNDTLHAEADVRGYCTSIGEAMLTREIELLKAAVQLDAATRSLYQYAGFFDQFLIGWRHSLSTTFSQAVRLFGSFARIPCFTASCDASPPPADEEE